jgi:hypothetical protein
MDFQRSATDDWYNIQSQRFDIYQTWKAERDVRLTGRIVNVEIDGTRARVLVEEIIDGIPYTQAWFYWNYETDENEDEVEDGWRHVPPDVQFWGDPSAYNGQAVTVRYFGLDQPFADSLGTQLDSWVSWACETLGCANLPPLVVEVVPDDGLIAGWAAGEQWHMRLPSPLLTRIRSDMPFSPDRREDVAALLAVRLVDDITGGVVPIESFDAAFLHDQIVAWLVGRMVQIDPQTHLISSLAANYGEMAVGQLLRQLQPASTIAVMGNVIALPLDAADLDWRDFFTWRLQIEDTLVDRRDSEAFYRLYDVRDPSVQPVADSRFARTTPAERVVVVLVRPGDAAAFDGSPQVVATVEVGEAPNTRQETVLFRLVDGNWLRAN